jgi:hypothetical protein
MAPLLLLPYAAQGSVASLLRRWSVQRLLCPSAGFDLGGGARRVPQKAQILAAAKSALLVGRWLTAKWLCSLLPSFPSHLEGVAALQELAVRRCPAHVVKASLVCGLRCEPAALRRAFRERGDTADAPDVFALCHQQLAASLMVTQYQDMVEAGTKFSHRELSATTGWQAAVQLCLWGVPAGPRPALCHVGVQEKLLDLATSDYPAVVPRVGELIAGTAVAAAAAGKPFLLNQILMRLPDWLAARGKGFQHAQALAHAVCRLTSDDDAGSTGWGDPESWDEGLPPLASAALFAALDKIWAAARRGGIRIGLLQAVVAAAAPSSGAAPHPMTMSMAGRAWLVPHLARAGLRLGVLDAQPSFKALRRQLAGCSFGGVGPHDCGPKGAWGGVFEEEVDNMAYAYCEGSTNADSWRLNLPRADRLQLAVMRSVRHGRASDVVHALDEQWDTQSQVGWESFLSHSRVIVYGQIMS